MAAASSKSGRESQLVDLVGAMFRGEPIWRWVRYLKVFVNISPYGDAVQMRNNQRNRGDRYDGFGP